MHRMMKTVVMADRVFLASKCEKDGAKHIIVVAACRGAQTTSPENVHAFDSGRRQKVDSGGLIRVAVHSHM